MNKNFNSVVTVSMAASLIVLGCSQSYPLSITLMDPNTQTVRTCSARERSSGEIPMLSRIVEACAAQLEAHGFVRVNDVDASTGATNAAKTLQPTTP